MKQSDLDSMSIDELLKLHERITATLAVWIAANHKHMFSAVASHVGQPHGLILEQKVRDRPGHAH